MRNLICTFNKNCKNEVFKKGTSTAIFWVATQYCKKNAIKYWAFHSKSFKREDFGKLRFIAIEFYCKEC